jgi:hypothetical protein
MSRNRLSLLRAVKKLRETEVKNEEIVEEDSKAGVIKRSLVASIGVGIAILGIHVDIKGST